MDIFYILLLITVVLIISRWRKSKISVKGYKTVPEVAYNLPFVGHGLAFSWDIMGFIQQCRKSYGDIFHIKIFRKNLCVICDTALVKEFFKKQEPEISMYENLKSIYFDYGFSDNGDKLDQIIDIMNKTIKIRFDEFLPKIIEEAERMSLNLKGEQLLTPLTINFVSRTSARCFLGISLTESMSKLLDDFANLLNRIAILTYFLPKWLIIKTFGIKLTHIRKTFGTIIKPYILEYRVNPNKTDSLIMRHCIDRRPSLSDDDICDAIICLLYVSSENTALGLNAAITDLLQNPKYLEKLRAEIFQTTDYKQMIHDPNNLLQACVLESARLNSSIFAIMRNCNKSSTLGTYYIGNIDHVALCEPILMAYPSASKTFDDPTRYYPERYLTNKTLSNPKKLITWGAGSHLCPGKLFAIYEIKTAIIYLLKQYDIYAHSIPALNYFSPSAFADRNNMKVTLDKTIFGENNIITQKVGDSILLRNYLSADIQLRIYNSITENSILNEKMNLMDIISKLGNKIKIPKINKIELYRDDQEYDDSRIYINIGASVVMLYGTDQLNNPRYIVLNSGDIFICDFSKNSHKIKSVISNKPQWFQDSQYSRYSVHLRNIRDDL